MYHHLAHATNIIVASRFGLTIANAAGHSLRVANQTLLYFTYSIVYSILRVAS